MYGVFATAVIVSVYRVINPRLVLAPAAVVAPVPPFSTGSVPVTVEVARSTAETASFAAVMPASLTRRASLETSIVESSTLTSSVLPDLLRAEPAVI